MPESLLFSQEKKKLLEQCRTIAIVGLSDNPSRASNRIGKYLQSQGYIIVPVNPNLEEVLGEKCYPDLQAIPFKIDLVDVFRRSEEVYAIVNAAREMNIPAVSTQSGVYCDDESIKLAQDNKITLVENACIMVEHKLLIG